MRILSMTEFREFCHTIEPCRYIFDGSLKRDAMTFNGRLEFSHAGITLAPDRIYFRDEFKSIAFSFISEVAVEEITADEFLIVIKTDLVPEFEVSGGKWMITAKKF